MNSLKKGEGVPLLNFEGGPGILLLNFEGGPGVPLLNFRGTRVPLLNFEGGPGSRSHFYTMPRNTGMNYVNENDKETTAMSTDVAV